MKPIKTLAGEVLLYFYAKQRKLGFETLDIVSFMGWEDIQLNGDAATSNDLLKISDSPADI
jgi:hypothetical protein